MTEHTMESLLAIEPKEKPQKIFVGGGVYLYVSKQGTKTWRTKFRHRGKEYVKSLGRFPGMVQRTATALAFEMRAMLKEAADPDLIYALRPSGHYLQSERGQADKARAEAAFEERIETALKLPCEEGSFVYFMRAVEMNCVKIGFAHDVAGRLNVLQAGQPYTLEVIATIPGGVRHEGLLHAAFKAERIRGEWFTLSARLQSFIERL